LIAGIGIYGAIGYGLDRLFGTTPILFAIGMVGGMAGSVYLVWIKAKENASKGSGTT
jgi:F0F1-type ATP synthase assembly protein I